MALTSPEKLVYIREWKRANKERVRESNRLSARRSYAANPAKFRARAAAFRTANKATVAKRVKSWREKNAAHVKKYSKTYRTANAAARSASWKAWYQKNKKSCSKRNLKWAQDNRARFNERARGYYKKHREKRLIACRLAEVKRFNAPGSHTVAEWMAVVARHGWKCLYCSVDLTEKTLTKDHKTPLCRRGSNSADNLAPACLSCNCKKRHRTAEEYMEIRRAA